VRVRVKADVARRERGDALVPALERERGESQPVPQPVHPPATRRKEALCFFVPGRAVANKVSIHSVSKYHRFIALLIS
jgi:hypothetical protein